MGKSTGPRMPPPAVPGAVLTSPPTWPTRSFQRKNNDSVGLRVSAAGGGLRVGPLKGAVDGGAGDGEHLGEVGDGVLAGGGHPGQLALLPGGQLRLLAMQLAFGAGNGHALTGPH